jgi:anti-sigma factor RsiW
MTHEAIRDRLVMLDDPELPEVERQAVLAHVAGCGDCAVVLRQWRAARAPVAASRPMASEAFVESVMRRLPAPEPPSLAGSWSVWLGWIPRLALSAAAVALALTLAQQPDPVSTETLLLARAPEGSAWEFASDAPAAEALFDDGALQ